MKLQTTKLCVNCESLYEGIGPCPYCRSEVFLWLFRALGTVLEADPKGRTDPPFPAEKGRVPHYPVQPSVSPTQFIRDSVMQFRSFAEFRSALNRLGRETVRFLTLGMIQAYK
jgi:hypothetical protein